MRMRPLLATFDPIDVEERLPPSRAFADGRLRIRAGDHAYIEIGDTEDGDAGYAMTLIVHALNPPERFHLDVLPTMWTAMWAGFRLVREGIGAGVTEALGRTEHPLGDQHEPLGRRSSTAA